LKTLVAPGRHGAIRWQVKLAWKGYCRNLDAKKRVISARVGANPNADCRRRRGLSMRFKYHPVETMACPGSEGGSLKTRRRPWFTTSL
jgi:hypothetical protein